MKRIVPSKIDWWEGTPVEGDAWTAEQRAGLARDRRPHQGHYAVKVKFQRLVDRQNQIYDVVTHEFDCPLLAMTATGILVITPSGYKKWIDRTELNP